MRQIYAALILLFGFSLITGCGNANSGSNQPPADPLLGRWTGSVNDPNAQAGSPAGTLTITITSASITGIDNVSGTEVINGGNTTTDFSATLTSGVLLGTTKQGQPLQGTANLSGGQLTGSFYTCANANCSTKSQAVPFTLTKQ